MEQMYLSVSEIADLLRCEAHGTANDRENKLKQARHWLTVNKVPGVRVGKRSIFRRDDIEAALAEAREISLAAVGN